MHLAARAQLESSTTLGTRHRAAVGITDETDAIAIVVSEETGRISLVSGGASAEELAGPQLRQRLLRLTGHIRSQNGAARSSESAVEDAAPETGGGPAASSGDPIPDRTRVPEPSS